MDLLPSAERARAEHFAFERDRRNYLATRVMVRRLLSRYADVPPEYWRFRANAYGRPEVVSPTNAQWLHFNLSHTATRVVCAITRCPQVGIDVESRVPAEFASIAEAFFSPLEVSWMGEAQDLHAARQRFLQLWTLKEAYVKAIGTGLSSALNEFSVLPVGDRLARLAEPRATASTPKWAFQRWMLEEGCAMAVAVRNPCGCTPQFELHDYL